MAPGWALAMATNSETELALTEGCTTSTLLSDTSADTGMRSFIGSKGILAYRNGLMAEMPLVVMKMV